VVADKVLPAESRGQRPAVAYTLPDGTALAATFQPNIDSMSVPTVDAIFVGAAGQGFDKWPAAEVRKVREFPIRKYRKGQGKAGIDAGGGAETKPPAGTQTFAAFTPLAPKVDPLPEAEIDILFQKIGKGEKIELIKLYQAVEGPQAALRADAARELGKYGDKSSVPYLIDALSDESTHVGADYPEPGMDSTRYWANDSLKKLTGKDFGFVWDDPIEKRNRAITKWREWFSRQKMADFHAQGKGMDLAGAAKTFPAIKAVVDWHQQVGPKEIRMSWYDVSANIAKKCDADMAGRKVHLVMSDYEHAEQSDNTRELTDDQAANIQDLADHLPAQADQAELQNLLLVSVQDAGHVKVQLYDRLKLPAEIFRLYRLTGAYLHTDPIRLGKEATPVIRTTPSASKPAEPPRGETLLAYIKRLGGKVTVDEKSQANR